MVANPWTVVGCGLVMVLDCDRRMVVDYGLMTPLGYSVRKPKGLRGNCGIEMVPDRGVAPPIYAHSTWRANAQTRRSRASSD